MRERALVQRVEPAGSRSDRVERHHAPHAERILGRREQRDPAAPRMADEVPLRDAERLAERRDVEHVVLHTGGAQARRCLRLTAAALIVEDHLATGGEGREGRPEQVVAVDHPAVDREHRRRAWDGRARPDGEVESADLDRAAREGRRTRPATTPVEIAGLGVAGGE